MVLALLLSGTVGLAEKEDEDEAGPFGYSSSAAVCNTIGPCAKVDTNETMLTYQQSGAVSPIPSWSYRGIRVLG